MSMYDLSSTHSRHHRQRDAVLYIILLVLMCIFLAPFLWLVVTGLKTEAQVDTFHVTWIPNPVAWENFLTILRTPDFLMGMINSIILAGIYVPLVTMSSAFVGFGFARLSGRGKNVMFIVLLGTLMMPQIITLIPVYFLYSRLGFINTYWPWVFSGLATSPFLVFLFRQFFLALPVSLEEAAIIDGAGYVRIFWQIFLPLTKPALATAALLSFTWVWGDYITPALFLSADNRPLSLVLQTGFQIGSTGYPSFTLLSAASICYIIPVLIVFFLGQRYFIQGIVTSGLK